MGLSMSRVTTSLHFLKMNTSAGLTLLSLGRSILAHGTRAPRGTERGWAVNGAKRGVLFVGMLIAHDPPRRNAAEVCYQPFTSRNSHHPT